MRLCGVDGPVRTPFVVGTIGDGNPASEETAMRVTRDALVVETPIWMIGDNAYDTLDWHDLLLTTGAVPGAS